MKNKIKILLISILLLLHRNSYVLSMSENQYNFLKAIKKGRNIKEIAKLVEDFNFSDSSGDSPLHYAVTYRQPWAVKFCLKNGADVNSQNFIGNTPLHYAVAYRQPWAVKFCLKNGADVNSQNFIGNTPLHFLMEEPLRSIKLGCLPYVSKAIFKREEREILHKLLRYNPNIRIKNNEHLLPEDLIVDNYNLRNHFERYQNSYQKHYVLWKELAPWLKNQEVISEEELNRMILDTGIQDLSVNMYQMFNCRDDEGDFEIILGGECFRVHQAILSCRSKFFVFENTGEDTFNFDGIVLNEQINVKTFEIFLEYLYTGNIQSRIPRNIKKQLLFLANYFELSEEAVDILNDICRSTNRCSIM